MGVHSPGSHLLVNGGCFIVCGIYNGPEIKSRNIMRKAGIMSSNDERQENPFTYTIWQDISYHNRIQCTFALSPFNHADFTWNFQFGLNSRFGSRKTFALVFLIYIMNIFVRDSWRDLFLESKVTNSAYYKIRLDLKLPR